MKIKFINRYDNFQKIFRVVSLITEGNWPKVPSRKFTIALCKPNIGYRRGHDKFEMKILFVRLSYTAAYGGRFV